MATDVANPAPSAPAPPSAPPPATSAPGGFEAGIDSMVDRIAGEPDGGSPPDIADDGEAPLTPPEVVTGDEPLLDEPELAAGPPTEPTEPPEDVEFAKEITPDKIADGKYWTSKAKWDRLQASDKTVQALREMDPGITVDGIKEMHGRTLALDEMISDFDSGDPARVTKVAGTFTGVDANGRPNRNPESVAAFVDSAMMNAARYYPAAYKIAEDKVLITRAQRQFAKYKQTGAEADKMLAWNLEYEVRGPGADYSKYTNPQATQQQDPLAQERAAFERDKQSYQFQKYQDKQAEATQAVNAAEAEARSVVDQSIESALSVIPTNVREGKAAEYKHAVRDLREGFEEATKANDNYTKPRNTLLAQLRANPTPEARSALVAFEKRWAEWIIGRAKPEVVSRFSNGVIRQNAQANAKQEKLQERREPGGNNGTPAQRATLQQKLRDPKTKYEDGVNSLFDALSRR